MDVARRQGVRVIESQVLRVRAQVRRATSQSTERVLADLRAALSVAAESGARAFEDMIRAELQQVLAADGSAEPTRSSWLVRSTRSGRSST